MQRPTTLIHPRQVYKGSCFAARFNSQLVAPAGMGYCHCESCRKWSAGPVNAFTAVEPCCSKGHARSGQNRHLQQDAHQAIANGASPCVDMSYEHPAWTLRVYAATISVFRSRVASTSTTETVFG